MFPRSTIALASCRIVREAHGLDTRTRVCGAALDNSVCLLDEFSKLRDAATLLQVHERLVLFVDKGVFQLWDRRTT